MPIKLVTPYVHTSYLAATEPSWEAVDRAGLPRMAFALMGQPNQPGTWALAHHFVQDGVFYLHRGGLDAAWQAALANPATPAFVLAHLRQHYSALGLSVADLRAIAPELDITDLDVALASLNLTDVALAFTHNSVLAKHEPTWGTVDKAALPDAAFARKPSGGAKASRGYPHHWVKDGSNKNADGEWTDGTMFLHKGGLTAAWSAAHGARSGTKADNAVLAHLRAHFSALGIKKAEVQALDPAVDLAATDAMLVATGLLSQEAIDHKDVAARVSYILQCECGGVCDA